MSVFAALFEFLDANVLITTPFFQIKNAKNQLL